MLVQRFVKKSNQQYLIPDSLSHSGGIITAIINGVSYNVTLSGLVASSTYYLYLRNNSGTIQLFFSALVPSVYRVSFSDAILVGAFLANPDLAWGSFVTIEGTPKTTSNFTYTTTTWGSGVTTTGFGTVTSPNFNVLRDGKYLYCDFRFTTGTVAGSTARIGLPLNLVIDTSILVQTSYMLGTMLNNSSVNFVQMVALNGSSTTDIYFNSATALSNTGLLGNASPFASGQLESGWFRVPIVGWSNTPLKDL